MRLLSNHRLLVRAPFLRLPIRIGFICPVCLCIVALVFHLMVSISIDLLQIDARLLHSRELVPSDG